MQLPICPFHIYIYIYIILFFTYSDHATLYKRLLSNLFKNKDFYHDIKQQEMNISDNYSVCV
jgi:hypothetical protein